MGITYYVYKVEYRERFDDHWTDTKTGRCRIGNLNFMDLRGEFAFQLGVHPDLIVDWKEVDAGPVDEVANDQQAEDNATYNSIVDAGLARHMR